MTNADDDRARLAALDGELARIDRDRESAEIYGDTGPRYQRLMRRAADLRRERAEIAARLGEPSDPGPPLLN
jgi:hypothetical protein